MRLAYLRGEGSQESIDSAIAALEAAGSDRVVVDTSPRSRPQSSAAFLAFLHRMTPGDTLVVTDLSQLAQSTSVLVERLAGLIERDINVDTLSGELDTGDPATARTIQALAAFDKATRRPRTRQPRTGVLASNAGRPRRLSEQDLAKAREMIETDRRPVAAVARQLGISRATLYRSLRRG
jgi:DNA invertase Pin-like site-specific DNA recombinase